MCYDSPNSAGLGPPDGANVVSFDFTSPSFDVEEMKIRFLIPRTRDLDYCPSRLSEDNQLESITFML